MAPEAEDRLRQIQNSVTWAERERIAEELSSDARSKFPTSDLHGETNRRIDKLRTLGICRLPSLLDETACNKVLQYFSDTDCFSSHVAAHSDGVLRSVKQQVAKGSHYGSYSLEQSLLAPYVTELAVHPELVGLAEEYLRCVPTLYSVNTFWTFPMARPGLTHDFHRDLDDFRFVAVFVYWTPVTVGEGEFHFYPGTHNRQFVADRLRRPALFPFPTAGPDLPVTEDNLWQLGNGHGYGHADLYRTLFGANSISAEGPAGTIIAADTFGLHRGTLPGSRPRLCTWFRYGLYANTTFQHDQAMPVDRSAIAGRIQDDLRTRYITRLLLRG